jgi:HK97 family phage portal protein
MKWPAFLTFSRKSANAYDILREFIGRSESASGKVVNAVTAFEVSAVHVCLRVLGEGVAQVPLKLMKASADGRSRTEARTHPLYDVLANRPNPWQTSFEYREMLVMHAALCGDAYSFISRSTRGQILELIPFAPNQVVVRRADDHTLTYQVTAQSGSVQVFQAADIWHVKGPSWNSWKGLEAVKLAREAIGLSLATEEQQARLQKQGVRPSGIYSVEGTLSKEQYKDLRAWIESEMGGSVNSGKTMLLDRNAKFATTSMTGVDAETVATRRMQIEEICRFFRINPIMVGAESKNTTYASAEQMFLAHLVHTLAPWYSRLEQSIDANLLTDADRAAGIYSNFVEEGLLRGSATTTKDVILGYVNGGLMTPNEGRAKLDLNPDDDPASDELRIPANLVGSIEPADPAEPDDPADPADTPDEVTP